MVKNSFLHSQLLPLRPWRAISESMGDEPRRFAASDERMLIELVFRLQRPIAYADVKPGDLALEAARYDLLAPGLSQIFRR